MYFSFMRFSRLFFSAARLKYRLFYIKKQLEIPFYLNLLFANVELCLAYKQIKIHEDKEWKNFDA